VLPAPVLRAIDGFLKVGVTIAGTAFVLSGIGITLEAWSKSTGNAIDPTLDAFIVGKVEPNFTAGLLILLSFSVSLGLFAAAQLGSAGAKYKEDD
jgi:ABC-type dipeptide/oligopeptide/nickel transport system permease component